MKARRYAILGDIHGNWEALSAVLEDAEQNEVTAHVCVGDIVGYNASPSECLERVKDLKCTVVRGNHDHYCSHDESLEDFHPLAASVVDWTRRQLTEDQVAYLRSLRFARIVGGFTIVHSTLDMPEKWGYVFDTLEADAHFNYQTTSLCFHGHTHIPAVFEKGDRVSRGTYDTFPLVLGRKYFVNVGSVGQPRDGDCRSAYVIYDAEEKTVALRRVAYDIQSAQKRISEANLPERLARRLAAGR